MNLLSDFGSSMSLLRVRAELRGNLRDPKQARNLPKVLQALFSEPATWSGPKTSFANIRLSRYNPAWLPRIEGETGLGSHSETLFCLIETSRRENLICLQA